MDVSAATQWTCCPRMRLPPAHGMWAPLIRGAAVSHGSGPLFRVLDNMDADGCGVPTACVDDMLVEVGVYHDGSLSSPNITSAGTAAPASATVGATAPTAAAREGAASTSATVGGAAAAAATKHATAEATPSGGQSLLTTPAGRAACSSASELRTHKYVKAAPEVTGLPAHV